MTNVVGISVPFARTMELASNPLPVRTIPVAPAPIEVAFGLIESNTGPATDDWTRTQQNAPEPPTVRSRAPSGVPAAAVIVILTAVDELFDAAIPVTPVPLIMT